MILKKHNVVHYGEVLLLVLQDYQLDNGSRLEKFRGKEGQSSWTGCSRLKKNTNPKKSRNQKFLPENCANLMNDFTGFQIRSENAKVRFLPLFNGTLPFESPCNASIRGDPVF